MMTSISFGKKVLETISPAGPGPPLLRRRASASELARLDTFYQNTGNAYGVGNILRLQLTDCTVQVEIVKAFTPFTMAQAMLVRIFAPAEDLQGDFVLKVYDRRYIPDIRKQWRDKDGWTQTRDRKFEKRRWSKGLVEYFLDVLACEYLFYTGPDDEENESEGERDDAEERQMYDEAFFESLCLKMYRAELEAYRRLRAHHLDGTDVPRFISSVRVPHVYHSKHCHTESSSIEGIPGILMQYVPGFSLIELYETRSPPPAREDWKCIVDDGLRVVQYYSRNMEMLNADESIARNTLVHWDPVGDGWKCKLIDFGHCQFRQIGERKWEWRSRQAGQAEEAMFAERMELLLKKKKGFEYVWERSPYYEDLMRDFNGEFPGVEPAGYES